MESNSNRGNIAQYDRFVNLDIWLQIDDNENDEFIRCGNLVRHSTQMAKVKRMIEHTNKLGKFAR